MHRWATDSDVMRVDGGYSNRRAVFITPNWSAAMPMRNAVPVVLDFVFGFRYSSLPVGYSDSFRAALTKTDFKVNIQLFRLVFRFAISLPPLYWLSKFTRSFDCIFICYSHLILFKLMSHKCPGKVKLIVACNYT